MMRVSLFDRILLSRLIFRFSCYLCGLFSLYVLFEFALKRTSFPVSPFLYYLCNFSLRGEFFLSLAFLLASIHTLAESAQSHEFLSLQMAGCSLLKITRSFFFFAFVLTLAGLINFEYIYPRGRLLLEGEPMQYSHVGRIVLSDKTDLFYNKESSTHDYLHDVFWIKTIDEVWHIDSVQRQAPHKMSGVDIFLLQNFASLYTTYSDQLIPDNFLLDQSTIMPVDYFYKNLSIHKLHSLLRLEDASTQIHARTQLYYKLLMSYLPFLIATLLLSFIMEYHHYLSTVKIIGISIFAFILFYCIIRLGIVLAEGQLVAPFFALFAFPFVIQVISLYKVARLS